MGASPGPHLVTINGNDYKDDTDRGPKLTSFKQNPPCNGGLRPFDVMTEEKPTACLKSDGW